LSDFIACVRTPLSLKNSNSPLPITEKNGYVMGEHRLQVQKKGYQEIIETK
jgi:hypothetical protein